MKQVIVPYDFKNSIFSVLELADLILSKHNIPKFIKFRVWKSSFITFQIQSDPKGKKKSIYDEKASCKDPGLEAGHADMTSALTSARTASKGFVFFLPHKTIIIFMFYSWYSFLFSSLAKSELMQEDSLQKKL